MTYEQMVDLCKRERIRKNISVNEIAEKTGVERGNLYRFEKHPEVKMYSCLLAYFKCDVVVIYGSSVFEKMKEVYCNGK